MRDARPPAIEIVGLRAGYGATPVIKGLDLAVAPGEFVAILESSGCSATSQWCFRVMLSGRI
jgi:ABC-type Fe3+/spermidine/putrescine transport system ATPase subunit